MKGGSSMEFLLTFKTNGNLYDLWLCHQIDRYFVTKHGEETGKRPVTETAEGAFIFENGRHYTRIPNQVIEKVGSIIYG